MIQKSNLSDRKLDSQTKVCINAVIFILNESLINQRPADNTISFYFRQNRKLGSRDRRVILEAVFAVLRWWGWLIYLFPKTVKECFGNDSTTLNNLSKIELSYTQALKIIFISIILDNNNSMPDALFNHWQKWLRIEKFINRNLNLQEKCKAYSTAFKIKESDILDNTLPLWIKKEILPDLDWSKLLDFCQKRPPMWLRIQNCNKTEIVKALKNYGFSLKEHEFIENTIALYNPKINLYSLDEFKKGYFEVQDLASQTIGIICSPEPGERWWDACAGAGGKSLQLASIMKNKGKIVASDIREFKLEDLKKRAKRAKFFNISYSSWNGRKLSEKKKKKYDGVLVDAPCTCSGTWRRNPDAKWTTTKKQIDEITELQLKLLSNASDAVKPGGILVYATCSIFYRENVEVTKKFLALFNNFKSEPFINPMNNTQVNEQLQIYPWDGDCDATFIAKFRKL